MSVSQPFQFSPLNGMRDRESVVNRVLAITAFLLLATACAPAFAAGYWTCSDGVWVAVGEPRHLKPLKACGVDLSIPESEAACLAAGGRWAPVGIFPSPICRVPTRDGGRICGDDGECEGSCLADLTPAERAAAMKGETINRLGRCTGESPVFGCMAVVREGGRASILCRD